jgi:tetratricopeptide (TPR) repeat protein
MQIKLKLKNFFKRLGTWQTQVLLLAIAVVLTYAHTLDVPFYLDDFSSIKENPVIYNWQINNWQDFLAQFWKLWQDYPYRVIGYLSFALNYQVNQFQVAGYHIVNIFIHLLAGWAIFGLLYGLVRTPTLDNVLSENAKRWLPLVVALIFVLHPLQIQGVTYIVQRLASLAALFYIAAMACFIQARLNTHILLNVFWTFACLLFALLAFLTKQNTFTLPIALLLLELIFFRRYEIRLKGFFILSGIGLFLVSLALLFEQNSAISDLFDQIPLAKTLDEVTRETDSISRTAYLATQMMVLWTYISLFFQPNSSHIDYDYPISEGFFSQNENYDFIARLLDSDPIWAMSGHLLLLGIAIYALRRMPLLAFGILFYYLAHAVESSIIPIRDVIFEHRTYLPNLGIAILCAWLLVVQLPHWLHKIKINRLIIQTVVIVPVVALLLVLGYSTVLRNQMWREPVALWQHNVEHSPEKIRGWIILGKHLVQRGQLQQEQGQSAYSQHTLRKAIEALNHAAVITNNPDGTQTKSFNTVEPLLNLIVAHKTLGEYDQALDWINNALANNLRPFDRAKFLVNRGNLFSELGKSREKQDHRYEAAFYYRKSEDSYREAIKIYPENLTAQINLASILGMKGDLDEAIALYQKVLAIDPSNAVVKQNLQELQKIRQRMNNL